MAAPAKLLHVAALLGRVESTYGTAVSLTASTDGLQMQFDQPGNPVVFEIKYGNDGMLGTSMATLGQVARVAPAARYAEGTVPTLMRLPATDYSSTVLPSIHRLMLAAGFDASITASAGAGSVNYTPTAYGTTYSSLTLQAYERGESQVLSGALCDLQVSATDGKPPKFSFPFKAIAALPADASPVLPSGLDYPNKAVMPLAHVGAVLTFGTYTAGILKKWDFSLNRTLDPRVGYAGGSNAHLGFVPGARRPEFKVTLEATALQTTPFHNSSGFDPYSLLDVGTQLTGGSQISIRLGSTQNNRYSIGANQVQVTDVKRQGEGSTATFEVTLTAFCSTPLLNDDIYLLCN